MLPNAHLTLLSRMSGSRWVITSSWLTGSLRAFLYSFSVYSYHLFLISSTSVRSLLFLSFIVPMFVWNVPLVSTILLKRSLVFPILLFSSISLHWSLNKFFSFFFFFFFYLALLFSGTLHSVGCIFPFLLLPFASLLFSVICKPSSDNHFVFLYIFFLGMVLVTTSCTFLWTFIHSSSGTMSTRSSPLNLFITSTV